MFKKPAQKTPAAPPPVERDMLTLQLAEIKEISDLLFERLERKIKVLEALDQTVDKKIAYLERLLERSPGPRVSDAGAARQREIVTLARRGMKPSEIAEILGMAIGEVELILAVAGPSA